MERVGLVEKVNPSFHNLLVELWMAATASGNVQYVTKQHQLKMCINLVKGTHPGGHNFKIEFFLS